MTDRVGTRRTHHALSDQVMIDTAALLRRLETATTELTAFLRGQAVNSVLFSGLAVLDANGQHCFSADVPFATLAVANLAAGGGTTVTVAAGPPALGAPPVGAALWRVPPSAAMVFPLTGRDFTIYGAVGQVLNIAVFTALQPPSFASFGV